MDYRVVVEKVDNPLRRDVDQAAADLAAQVREQIASGWEPLGGVAVGAAGPSPYLLQAMIKR
jgi:hypothetical protein